MDDTTRGPLRALLATDGSEAARNAEEWLARARWSRPCEIDVLCVAGYGITRLGWSMHGDRSTARQIVEQLRESEVIASERTANEASLRLQHAGFRTRTLARHGDVADEIIATVEAEAPDLVALGPRGRSRVSALFLGSVSREVIAAAEPAVLVAREPTEDATLPRSILVLVDRSEAGTSAVDWLIESGWAKDARIDLVALLGVPPGVDDEEEALVAQVSALLRESALEALDRLAERLLGTSPDVNPDMRTGHPVEVATELARELGSDLTVIGRRRGRRGNDPFAEKVARYASNTVLMIPER
ncbi:MAG: universal stress protein [Candidatus Limnocylindrales bacterium]